MNAANKAYRELWRQLGLDLIREIVGSFYDQARTHPRLGPYFDHVVDWEETKEHITHFWWIDMGGERYRPDIYNPVAVHRRFRVPAELVDDWVELFVDNLRRFLDEKQVDLWRTRVEKFAEWTRIELTKSATAPPGEK